MSLATIEAPGPVVSGPPRPCGRRYRHVLCVYPYRRELGSLGFLPPLGLEYIASVIESHAESMDIVDMRIERGCARDFLRPQTDLVCFSVNWKRDEEFVNAEVRSIDPHVMTIIGGRHASEDPEKWLRDFPNVDAVVRGDGEEAMQAICLNRPWQEIPGLSYRRDGVIVHNPSRQPGPIADAEPCRGRRRKTYQVTVGGFRSGLEVDLVAGSRGCPFNCAFCSFSRNPLGIKRTWTARTPESVVDELEHVSAPIVAFTDDLFTKDMDRVERICDLIIERGIRKRYIINARLEIARRPDVLAKMERAGFAVLLLGVESAQDKTLHSMRKGFTTADIRRYCRVLRRSVMIKHGYFLLGAIGESVDEMMQIAPFAREIGMDSISLSTLRVSPFSGLEELVAQSPGYHITPKGKIYSDHCPAAMLRKLRRQINRRFYTPGQVLHLGAKLNRLGAANMLPMLMRSAFHRAGGAVASACRRLAPVS